MSRHSLYSRCEFTDGLFVGRYTDIKQSLMFVDNSIVTIRSLPTSSFFTLLLHWIGHNIDMLPFPLGRLKPASGSDASEHLVKLSLFLVRIESSFF